MQRMLILSKTAGTRPTVRRARRLRRGSSTGQIVILFALTLVILMGMLAVALDGTYGLLQSRRAQNAADFASLAGTQQLTGMCEQDIAPPTQAYLTGIVSSEVAANAPVGGPDTGVTWTAQYLDGQGNPISGATFNSGDSSGWPPFNACGVQVTVTPSWRPYIAGVLGYTSLTTNGVAAANNTPATGTDNAIISLNPDGPHVVLGGGTGTFVVSGNVYTNSIVPSKIWSSAQTVPKVGSATPSGCDIYDDAIDAKQGANLYVYGTIQSPFAMQSGSCNGKSLSVPAIPFDWCFGAATTNTSNNNDTLVPAYKYQASESPALNIANNPPGNHGGGTQCPGAPILDFNFLNASAPGSQPDPFAPTSAAPGGIPVDPFSTAGIAEENCPGAPNLPTFSQAQFDALEPSWYSGTTLVLQPGDYNFLFDLSPTSSDATLNALATTSGVTVDFADCFATGSTYTNGGTTYPKYAYDPVTSGSSNWSGTFLFPDGLWLDSAGATDQVNGNNVLLATGTSVAKPGNVPYYSTGAEQTVQATSVNGATVWDGNGDGAPCVPNKVSEWDGTYPPLDTTNGGGDVATMPAPATATPGGGDCLSSTPKTEATDSAGNPLYGVANLSNGTPSSKFATGMNFSLELGQTGTTPPTPGCSICLTAPSYGAWGGIGLWQERCIAGNFGFDAQPGDQATISVSGLVYNATLPPMPGEGCASPSIPAANASGIFTWWDVGIPEYSGGTLQAGYGANWQYNTNPCLSPYPTGLWASPGCLGNGATASAGSVSIGGIALVDDFNTDGHTNILIQGTAYQFANGGYGASL